MHTPHVIADRLCIAWRRKNKRQTELLEDSDISDIDTEAYSRYIAMEQTESCAEARHDLVEKLLAKLKVSNRTTITLHYLEGMTYAEISNFLGISENTIKSRLHRARQQLKKYEFMIQEGLGITIEAEHRSQIHLSKGLGMKLTLNRNELLYSLQFLQGFESGLNTPSTPSNVLIHAEGNTIECTATDMEIGIKMKIEGTVREDGAITVSTPKLGNIVKELPSEEPINLTTKTDGLVEITCGDEVYKIVGLTNEEVPQLPSVDEGALAIDGEALLSAIHKTKLGVHTEGVRQPFQNGLYFNLFEDRTEVVVCDNFQLALTHCGPLKISGNSGGFIVPLNAVKEIERTFANSSEIRISRAQDQILFADERATLTTGLVDAEYPKYENLIPKYSEVRTVVPKDTILRAIRKVSLVSDPKTFKVCLEIDEQQIRVSAETPKPNEVYETLAVESSTGSIRIGLDARLLMDTFAHIETESLALEFSGELEPVMVKPIGEEGHLYLIMPMLLNS